MSVNALAKALGIGAARFNEIIHGERGITANTALRVASGLLQHAARILAEPSGPLRPEPSATESQQPHRTRGSATA